jgi:hypothetical protein
MLYVNIIKMHSQSDKPLNFSITLTPLNEKNNAKKLFFMRQNESYKKNFQSDCERSEERKIILMA